MIVQDSQAKSSSGASPTQLGDREMLPAMRLVGRTNQSRLLARVLVLMFFGLVLVFVFAPWVQNVQGFGKVVALTPIERQQTVDAPVEGRIKRWHVVEGSRVKPGDVLADIMDNDPLVLLKLQEERGAVVRRMEEAKSRVVAIENRVVQLDATRRNELEANLSRISESRENVRAAEQSIRAAEATLTQTELNIERRKRLVSSGLSSVRDLELAEEAYRRALADLERLRNTLQANRNAVAARESDQKRIETSYQTQLQDAQASLASARGDVANANAELQRTEVRVARQSAQVIQAPRDGVVLRLLAQPGSELLKAGDPVALLVPDSGSLVVELWMNGNDVPLIKKGDKVRLQFEGWPAVQWAGWPSVAIGTFGGQVFLVDATDNGQGKFRILVEPDPNDQPWPSTRYLRQGVRANGWVLLNQVTIGFELWRQFNGFPPKIADTEPGASGKTAKGVKEEKK
jgi:multidrug resistance efflux pump